MILDNMQQRSWPLHIHGNVMDLENSRPDTFDCFHPVVLPTLLAITGRKMVGIDRRGEFDNIISLDAEKGILYLEGTLDRYHIYIQREEIIDGQAGAVEETSPCGDFLVCRRADGTLRFLRWEDDISDYTALGSLPKDLRFTVEYEAETPVTFSIEACTWSRKVADLRTGVPESVRSQTEGAVKRAWEKALESCRNGGRLVQPVTVKVMARLWDGSVFCVSEGVRVPTAPWQGYDRMMLPVTFDADGNAIGTTGGSFAITPYRVKVTLEAPAEPLWNEFFKDVEIFVEQESSVLSGADMSVVYLSDRRSMSCFLPTRPTAELEADLGNGPWVEAAVLKPGVTEPVYIGPGTGKVMEVLPAQAAASGLGDRIMAHGPFLHIARGDVLQTTEACNPMAIQSETRLGSRILAIAAMPGGGGAYTRQYLYVCTEEAVFALTHDALGRHTNCRPVIRQTVREPRMLCEADACVYALSDSGCLMRLENARPQILFRGLPDFLALQWDGTADELYLVQSQDAPAEASTLVLQLAGARRAYRRSVRATDIVRQSGRVLLRQDNSLVMVHSYPDYSKMLHDVEDAMVSLQLEAPGGRILKLHGAVTSPADLKLRLRAEDETLALTTTPIADDMLIDISNTEADWLSIGRRRYVLPFAAPATGRMALGPTLYRLTLTGRWSVLETPKLSSLEAKGRSRVSAGRERRR